MSSINFTSRSLDNLKALFNVVMGLALVESVKSVIFLNSPRAFVDIKYSVLPCFIALFFTIVPFHHGASRYLDDTYLKFESHNKKLNGLIDFLFFMFEAAIFYSAAIAINTPFVFTNIIVLILFVDILWIILTQTQNNSFPNNGIFKWLKLNVVSIILALILNYNSFWINDLAKNIVIMCVFIIRSSLDYTINWNFYWPSTTTQTIDKN